MTASEQPDTPSDLWISLEDAVEATGVSRRNLQSWVRSGQIKREKRKGKVFLWVSDLAELTPITRVDPETIPEATPEPEVLPSVITPSAASPAAMKAFGDRLVESVNLQKEILGRLDVVQSEVVKAQNMNVEAKPALDERTVKELSLLGNVFRSIHQQNEKVSEALLKQDEMLRNISENSEREKDWTDRWVNSEKKTGRYKMMAGIIAGVLVVVLLAFGVMFMQRLELERVQKESAETEKTQLISKVKDEQREKLLLKEEHSSKLSQLQAEHQKVLLEREQSYEMTQQSLKQDHDQKLQKLAMERSKALEDRDEKWTQELSELQTKLEQENSEYETKVKELQARHQEELERLNQLQKQLIESLGKKVDDLSETVGREETLRQRLL